MNNKHFWPTGSVLVLSLVVGWVLDLPAAVARDIDLANVPVLIAEGVPSNLFLTIDDSGSMARSWLPETIGEGCNPRGACPAVVNRLRIKSADFNPLQFNPDIDYAVPAYGVAGQTLPPASFDSACLSPFRFYNPQTGAIDCPANCTLNLGTQYRAPHDETDSIGFCDWASAGSGRDPLKPAECDTSPGRINPDPPVGTDCSASAFYYRANDACRSQITEANPRTACLDDDNNYERVAVGAGEEQNFANWFVYYRNRLLLAQTAASLAMAQVDVDTRVGYQGLYSALGPVFGWQNLALHGVSPFGGASRTAFYDWLFGLVHGVQGVPPIVKDTPLHESAIRVGDYFSGSDAYRDTPGDANTPVRECRRNFHLLVTDGAWTLPVQAGRRGAPGQDAWTYLVNNTPLDAIPVAASDNWDADDPIPAVADPAPPDLDPNDFLPAPPYKDANKGSLADIAFYYWARDLCTDAACTNTLRPVARERRDLDGVGGVTESEVYRNPRNDPAFWQHLVTYTVGLGVDGNLAYAGDSFPSILFTEEDIWSDAGAFDMTVDTVLPSDQTRVDDLWHAAINGRGEYFNARNVQALTAALGKVLAEVGKTGETPSSASAAVVTTGSLSTASKLYLVSFRGADWSGEIQARNISLGDDGRAGCDGKARGELCDGFAWAAAAQLEALDPLRDRMIATFDPESGANGDGVAFRWDSLGPAQRASLQLAAEPDDTLAQRRVFFLRGDHGDEQLNGGTFRDRLLAAAFQPEPFVLGDIVNSAPLYVGPPNLIYPDEEYRRFVSTNQDRTDAVFVGANDGQLHAFDADTGAELFAYIPGLLFDKLADLTTLDYQHLPYVDGPLAEGDIQIGGAWKTVLVGALGKGAQGLFALDITDPAPADETAAADMALWEISDADDPDLGYVYGTPAIVRICIARDNDGTCSEPRWVAVVGNGYNNTDTEGEEPLHCSDPEEDGTICTISETGNAVLYLLDIEHGRILADDKGKLDTGVGRLQDPTTAVAADQRPNGLAKPTVVDADGDLFADFAYAGDLFGNVWKFDLTHLPSTPKRLFTAQDATVGASRVQPITTPVAVERHPTGVGTLVLFGTGKFLGLGDVGDLQVQTFYGIWDDGAVDEDNYVSPQRRDLLQQWFFGGVQQAEDEDGNAFSEARVSTDRPIDWETQSGWYIDLCPAAANGTCAVADLQGERMVVTPAVRANRVVFVTLIPSGNPCVVGGTSWVNALDARDGSRLGVTPFDFNGDGIFGSLDTFTVRVDGADIDASGSSIRLVGGSGGVYSAPAAMALEGGETMGYVSTSSAEVVTLRESSALGWRVWQEVR